MYFQYMDEYMKHCIQIFFMMSVWTSAVLPLVKIKPLNRVLTLCFLIWCVSDAGEKQDFFNLCWDEKHILFCKQTFSLNVSRCYTWFFSNHREVVMTYLSLNLPILEKPYHTPGRQLCQLVILIWHPVWAFPHELPETGERQNITIL